MRRIPAKILEDLHQADTTLSMTASGLLLDALNAVIDGLIISDEDLLNGIDLHPETEALLLEEPSGEKRPLLNRLLLQDAYPWAFKPHDAPSPDGVVQQLQKLSLIRDQLVGTGNDVTVNLIDVGLHPLDPPQTPNSDARGNFTCHILSPDLRISLIAYIDDILANGGTVTMPPVVCIANIQPRFHGGPLRFCPMLQIMRANTNLPVQNELPVDPDLSVQILRQIQFGETRMPFGLPDNRTDKKNIEFTEIALSFSINIAPRISCQTAIARNRFNEHEMWFVPNAAFPTVAAGVDTIYATPRPLKTTLANETFIHPDFNQYTPHTRRPRGIPSPISPWNGFTVPTQPVNHARVDCDVLAKRIFLALEGFLKPSRVTDFGQYPGIPDLLKGKDEVAHKLATSDKVLVSLFKDTSPNKNHAGVHRMGLDAFQQSLRAFYQIDTFVGLPLSVSRSVDLDVNYYGKAAGNFSYVSPQIAGPPPPPPAQPSLSDFLLSLPVDFPASIGNGYLTTIYRHNLPQGQEKSWLNWKLSNVKADITHIQLAVPGESKRHAFDKGRWLELVYPPGASVEFSWNFDHPIPAIIRTFPVEPAIQAVTPLKLEALVPNPPENGIPIGDLQHCDRWGWQVDFGGVYNSNDTVYLDVDYYEQIDSQTEEAKLLPQWGGPQNLAQTLIVLDLLMSLKDWRKEDIATNQLNDMITAAVALLGWLAQYLGEDPSAKHTSAAKIRDSYKLRIDQASPTPGTGTPISFPSPPDLLVKTLYFSSTPSASDGNYYNYSIKADIARGNTGENTLRLFGSPANSKASNIRAFKPQLTLRRNDAIPHDLNMESLQTNDLLVYVSGPVIWPQVVPVTNKWPTFYINDTPGNSLNATLSEALSYLFGATTPLDSIVLQFELKHGFSLLQNANAPAILSNSLFLLPTDYGYTTALKLAGDIAASYINWIGEGSNPVIVLHEISRPSLQLSLMANKRGKLGSVIQGHTLLQIDAINFPTDKIFWKVSQKQ